MERHRERSARWARRREGKLRRRSAHDGRSSGERHTTKPAASFTLIVGMAFRPRSLIW